MLGLSRCSSSRSTTAPARSLRPSYCSWISNHRWQTSSTQRGSCQVAKVANVTEAAFADEVLQASQPVLVDFWATWCGPCKLVAPLMDWAEKEYGEKLKVVKVEHDSNPELIAKYKVYGLPTLLLFKDGELVTGSKREGAVNKPMLQKYLQDNGIVV